MFCKDYAAWTAMEIAPIKNEEPSMRRVIERTLSEDGNADRIADTWQRVEVNRWNMQYGFVEGESDWIDPDDPDTWTPIFGENGEADAEMAMSEGPTGDSPAMADDGDGLTAHQEYRGFFLDGGPGIDAPRHKRLSVARKEFLVECSIEDDWNNPANHGEDTNAAVIANFDLNETMKQVSHFYRNTAKGGFIDLYWVFDPIDMPGEIIHYQKHFPIRGSREWNADVRAENDEAIKYTRHGATLLAQGTGIPTFDRAYRLIDPEGHNEIYSYSRGNTMLLQATKNPMLADFGHILMPGRIGKLEGGESGSTPDASVPRYLECPMSSRYHSVGTDNIGSVVAPASVADEGAIFWPSRNGAPFTLDEFSRLLASTVAHELGHILVGPWHSEGTGELTLMLNAAFIDSEGEVIGLDQLRWHETEIEKVNLRAAHSKEVP